MDAAGREAAVASTQRYVDRLLPIMRLAHWQITVVDEPPDGEDCAAEISCWSTRTMALLRSSDTYIRQTPAKQRRTIAHELTHCHFHQLAEAEEAHVHAIDYRLWEHLHRRYSHEEEKAVDEVARVIAPFLPLPPLESGDAAAG